jgi:hypothetical protein
MRRGLTGQGVRSPSGLTDTKGLTGRRVLPINKDQMSRKLEFCLFQNGRHKGQVFKGSFSIRRMSICKVEISTVVLGVEDALDNREAFLHRVSDIGEDGCTTPVAMAGNSVEGYFGADCCRYSTPTKAVGPIRCGVNTNSTEGSFDDVVGCLGTKSASRFLEVIEEIGGGGTLLMEE